TVLAAGSAASTGNPDPSVISPEPTTSESHACLVMNLFHLRARANGQPTSTQVLLRLPGNEAPEGHESDGRQSHVPSEKCNYSDVALPAGCGGGPPAGPGPPGGLPIP